MMADDPQSVSAAEDEGYPHKPSGPFAIRHRTGAWVAYMDILGYRDMVTRAVEASAMQELIGKLRADMWLVEQGGRMAREMGMADKLRIFSDSVCFAVHRTLGVHDFVYVLCDIVGRLAETGVFVRGAAVWGDHYDDDTLMLSPALIEAHKMESSQAIHPRVLLSDYVVRIYSAFVDRIEGVEGYDHTTEAGRIWRDRDGRAFLNYLTLFHDIERVDSPKGHDWLKEHRDRIVENLAAHRDRAGVTGKYLWLADYHNRFCRTALPADGVEAYLVTQIPDQGPWLSTQAS